MNLKISSINNEINLVMISDPDIKNTTNWMMAMITLVNRFAPC